MTLPKAWTPANDRPEIAPARRAAQDAETRAGRRRGELLALLAGNRSQLPPAVRLAFDAYTTAEDAKDFARERVSAARDAASLEDPDTAEGKRVAARLSALIAAHFMGLELVATSSTIYRWRVRDASGKTREVPNYAGDVGAIAKAEDMIADNDAACDRYGAILREVVGGDPYDMACAAPAVRAMALLRSIGVALSDDPPISPT